MLLKCRTWLALPYRVLRRNICRSRTNIVFGKGRCKVYRLVFSKYFYKFRVPDSPCCRLGANRQKYRNNIVRDNLIIDCECAVIDVRKATRWPPVRALRICEVFICKSVLVKFAIFPYCCDQNIFLVVFIDLSSHSYISYTNGFTLFQ